MLPCIGMQAAFTTLLTVATLVVVKGVVLCIDVHSCVTGCTVQLWSAYLKERRLAVRGLRVGHPAVEALNNTWVGTSICDLIHVAFTGVVTAGRV
jgi:hypothetical protein